MNTDMPPEFGIAFMKKMIGCKELAESVEAKDKQRTLDILIDCAMADLKLIRLIPNLDQVGLAPVIDEKETEFRTKLQKVCGTWQKQK